MAPKWRSDLEGIVTGRLRLDRGSADDLKGLPGISDLVGVLRQPREAAAQIVVGDGELDRAALEELPPSARWRCGSLGLRLRLGLRALM